MLFNCKGSNETIFRSQVGMAIERTVPRAINQFQLIPSYKQNMDLVPGAAVIPALAVPVINPSYGYQGVIKLKDFPQVERLYGYEVGSKL